MSVREITAILVSWKDAGDLVAAVASLAAARTRVAQGGVAVSLVVVDNGGDLSEGAVRAAWPDATVLVNAANRGFGPAANQAAAAARGDVLLFLNPDTRAEGEPFSPIARAFDADERVVAVAPRLVEMDGGVPPAGTLRLAAARARGPGHVSAAPPADAGGPTPASCCWSTTCRPTTRRRRRFRYADENRDAAFPVEQAAAAALAVRREAFVACGGFDERYVPAWYEDVDLCARLASAGTILYLPEARFRHRGGESASRLGYARFLPLFYRNALRYRRDHYGLAARLTYRVLLAKGMLLRLLLLPFRADRAAAPAGGRPRLPRRAAAGLRPRRSA